MRKLSEKLEQDEKQIRDAIAKMDSSFQNVLGRKKSSKFVYKKLPLAGEDFNGRDRRLFETISEDDFNSVADKENFGIDSLKLSRHANFYL